MRLAFTWSVVSAEEGQGAKWGQIFDAVKNEPEREITGELFSLHNSLSLIWASTMPIPDSTFGPVQNQQDLDMHYN